MQSRQYRKKKASGWWGHGTFEELKEGEFGQKAQNQKQDGEVGGAGPCRTSGINHMWTFVLILRARRAIENFCYLESFFICFYRRQACTKTINYMMCRAYLKNNQK